MAVNDDAKLCVLIIERINNIVEQFANNNIDKRTIKLFLANGDCIFYSIPKESIAHLLGVNTINLNATGLFNTTNSYAILEELYQKRYLISSMILNGQIKLQNIFSTHINQKIDVFRENTDINISSTNFICKYDANIAVYNGITEPHKCQYIVCKDNYDGSVLILHLVQNNNRYIPMSSRIFSTKEEAKEYLEASLTNQSITYLTNIIVKRSPFDDEVKIYLKPLEKRNHLLILKSYAQEYNANIDILSDYEYTLKTIEQKGKTNFIINLIIDSVQKGKTIDIQQFNDGETGNILSLINFINEHIQTQPETSLAEQIKNLQNVNEALTSQLDRYKTTISAYEQAFNQIGNIIEEQKKPHI